MYTNFRIATPSDIISSFPSPPAPAGHPVSLVSACPVTYTFPYPMSNVISLCTNVPIYFPMWFANPSPYDSFIHYTPPVFTGAFPTPPFTSPLLPIHFLDNSLLAEEFVASMLSKYHACRWLEMNGFQRCLIEGDI